jgi:hypothetical protein
MFFAVSGSAFILRARMAANHVERVPVVKKQGAVIVVAPEDCGTPRYRVNADGSTTVVYELCRDSKPLVLSPDSKF